MITTLKHAERRRSLKVTKFDQRLGPFGRKLLAGMDIKEGAELEIDPAFVSHLSLRIKKTTVQIGFESAMGIVLGERRLIDLKPGEGGIVTAIEFGRETSERFLSLGLAEGKNVNVQKYIPGPGPLFISVQNVHVAIVDIEGYVLVGDEVYDYRLPGELVFIDIDGEEKQLCTLATGEKGKITRILAGEHLLEEFDRHWIKEGAQVQALHRLETLGHPLMILINGVRHHIPEELTKKIYVDVI